MNNEEHRLPSQPLMEVLRTGGRVLSSTILVSKTYKSYIKEQMKRRELMICLRVLQDSSGLRFHGVASWFEFANCALTRECRNFLKQEPLATVLGHSTLSINVLHQLNVCTILERHLGSVRLFLRRHSVCISRESYHHGCGAMFVTDSLIEITSPHEFYMCTKKGSHDGEIDVVQLYLQTADNITNSALTGFNPTYYPSLWQALLVTLAYAVFEYFVIITNVYSMFSLKVVPSSH